MTTAPVHSITDEQLAELDSKAKTATPGQWGRDGYFVCPTRAEDGTTYVESWRPAAEARSVENARFIAAANPATILALITTIRQQRAELERLRAAPLGVPDGWKLVPTDATMEMVEALKARITATSRGSILNAGNALNDAIAAAPAAPAPAAQEPVKLAFPTMLRKMWSGGEVQDWLDRQGPLYTAQPAAEQPNTKAAIDVIAERRRQVEAEGWTPEHDDEHGRGELSTAAACYAIRAHDNERINLYSAPRFWPWDDGWKPGPPRSMLVKAGALIMAEIERLDRALLGKEGEA